ncbi:membrane associated rhomboid family serine protease [Hamadaea flava]|uniref:Uncharacterized protein n=1 Tax=Hamadaea flava TaxID=1742688 RepID=A0ABV8LGG8_9ACTN|nr:hypothetical protein [Hamadaea flava]MCP2326085.1 membrane associated rhomboid family serine protease [Hamadaea flava]
MSEVSQVDDTLRILLRDLAKESARPTIRPGRRLSTRHGTVSAMPSLSARIILALTVVYGGAVAILAILHSDAVGTFAAIGGVVIGILWVLRGLFFRNQV